LGTLGVYSRKIQSKPVGATLFRRAKSVFIAEVLRWNDWLINEAARAAACVSECPPHALLSRAGEGVGEGRVEEGGGARGRWESRRSVRGYHAAVGVHVDTQSACFCGNEAKID
jgi:hypothetical protein